VQCRARGGRWGQEVALQMACQRLLEPSGGSRQPNLQCGKAQGGQGRWGRGRLQASCTHLQAQPGPSRRVGDSHLQCGNKEGEQEEVGTPGRVACKWHTQRAERHCADLAPGRVGDILNEETKGNRRCWGREGHSTIKAAHKRSTSHGTLPGEVGDSHTGVRIKARRWGREV
jgi:hypothetical protein